MNLKSAICCTLLVLNLVDATNRHLRGHGPPLSWSLAHNPVQNTGMPVPEDSVPGNPPVVDIVVVNNMPVPGLPGDPPVTDMVVVNTMPVPGLPGDPPVIDMVVVLDTPEGTLLVNTNGPLEEPATEPIEEPTTGMGPSTIAIDELNPAISIPDTPGRIIPRSPPYSVLIAHEEASSGTSNASWCPETGSDTTCDEDVDPVFCGPEICMYGNLCLGIGAGFSKVDDCRSAR